MVLNTIIRILFLLILSCLSTALPGQSVAKLTRQLNEKLLPKERVSVLLELSEAIQRNNPKQGYEYALEARGIAALEQNSEQEVHSLVQMGASKMYLGEKAESLKLLDDAIKMAEPYGYDYLIAKSNHFRGLNYYMMGMDEKSLTSYHKALKINQRLGIKEESFRQLNNISLVYRDIKNHDMALSYLKKALSLAKELDNQAFFSFSSANIGFIYFDLEEYEKAIPYVNDLVDQIVEEKIKDSVAIAIGYNLKALLENGLEQYDVALKNAAKSLDVAKKIKFLDGEIHVMQTISKIRIGQEKYAEALKVANKALNKSDQTDTRRYTEGLLQTLISATKQLGDNQRAFEYQDRLLIFKDSLYNIEKSKLVDQLDIQYITREKEMENQELRVEHEKDQKIISLQKYVSILASFIGILFLGLSIVLFRSLRIKRMNNQELEAAIEKSTKELRIKNKELLISNQELERFAYVASHDLKEPLRNISSFANLINRKTNEGDNKELKEYADFIINGTKQMYDLTESILRFSKIKQQAHSELTSIDLNLVIDKIKGHLAIQLNEKNAVINSENLPVISGDEDQLFLLFKNLIENGIKYNDSSKPTITVSAIQDKSHFILSVKDNGIGIKKEYSKVIFEMFKRLHNRSKYSGSGMGLSICKKIVAAFNGEIWVESQPEQGSTFFVKIPGKPTSINTANAETQALPST